MGQVQAAAQKLKQGNGLRGIDRADTEHSGARESTRLGTYLFALGYNISVAPPIPEPSTYALILAGLGAVGFLARRRKQT